MFRRFETLVDPFQFNDPRTPPAGVWQFLLRYLRPLRPVMAASLGLTVIGAAIEVWLIGYAGHLVDVLAATTPQRLWSERGGELLAVALLVLLARPLAALLREALDDIAFRPNAEVLIRLQAHRHLLGQSVGWFRNNRAGQIMMHAQAAGSSATGAAYSVLHTLSFVAIYIAGSVWLMAAVDLRLILPLAIWVMLYLLLMVLVVPRYRRAAGRFQEAGSALTGMQVDTYANIDTVKLFANPAEEDREAAHQFGEFRHAFFGVQRVEVTMNSAMLFLGSLLMAGLIGYALVLWQGSAAPLGMVAAALALSFRITAMAEWLLDAMSALFGHVGTLRQALKTVAQPHAITDPPGAATLHLTAGGIRFENVTHRYGKEDGGLDRLTLDIAPGEKVGLVGRSGAGKSTLVNLLLRFHDLEAGRITIDDQDIRSVTQQSLRRHISMVGQDAALLHRSVRANIAHGRPDVTEAEIAAAARQAAADGFIAGLQDHSGRRGYDAEVGERGVMLSGGQRQRIALARAILKNAPILVLDEATSALDSEVEASVQESLYGLMTGRTVIAIAHRLSTIARMDRIVVLDEGRIVESGRHDDLLARHGIYATLWAHQSGGFLGAGTAR